MMRTASSMNVTTMRNRPIAGRYLCGSQPGHAGSIVLLFALRFEGLSDLVEFILDLASLLADLIKGRRVVRSGTTGLVAKLIVQPQVVARGASYLRHGGMRR